MPKTYKELHEEKLKLETLETLATVRQILQIISACADSSTNFQEFSDLLQNTIAKVELKMK